MKIWIGADHRGKRHKELVKDLLLERGCDVVDVGTSEDGPVDYPDFAIPVARAVREGIADRGVLICATGIGMSMAANRFRGVRATLCLTPKMAETARRHNDSNILCMAQDINDAREAEAVLKTWLETEFEGGRHLRRLATMDRKAPPED